MLPVLKVSSVYETERLKNLVVELWSWKEKLLYSLLRWPLWYYIVIVKIRNFLIQGLRNILNLIHNYWFTAIFFHYFIKFSLKVFFATLYGVSLILNCYTTVFKLLKLGLIIKLRLINYMIQFIFQSLNTTRDSLHLLFLNLY